MFYKQEETAKNWYKPCLRDHKMLAETSAEIRTWWFLGLPNFNICDCLDMTL